MDFRDVSGRETVVTLVACALLGLETTTNFSVLLAVLLGGGPPPYPLAGILGLVGGCVLDAVLLRQGGISVPSQGERGASRGALVGLALGAVASLFLGGPTVGVLGTCVLAGLAVGRALDHRGRVGGPGG